MSSPDLPIDPGEVNRDRADRANASEADDRLRSWKEVAAYLGRDVSTVQRWEKSEGLPIHRHRHHQVGSIYAFRSELDAWWQRDRVRLGADDGRPVAAGKQRPEEPSVPRIHRMAKLWPIGAVGLAIGAVAVAVVLVNSARAPSGLRLSDPIQITSSTGAEGWASWSPDGRMLAYAANRAGNWDIWVTDRDGGPAINRTGDHGGYDHFPSWSPDAKQIAFLSNRDATTAVYVMSPLAGPARRMAANALGAPQWSPDGAELAYLLPGSPRSTVEILSLGSGTARRVELPVGDLLAMDVKWSPDGRHFAYVTGAGGATLVSQVWLFRLADGHAAPITDGLNHDRSPAWAPDSRSLLIVSDRTGTTDLWRQHLASDGAPEGPPEAITAGVGIRTAELSRDGRRLAYTTGRLVANLWRLPILAGQPASWADAQPLTSEQAFIEAIDLSPDGTELLIGSDRGGNHDVWRMSVANGQLQRVTTDPAADFGPRWSPDGRSVVFYSHRGGNRDVWTMQVDGGSVRRITQDPAQDMWPSWSPDGSRIVFLSTRNGRPGAFVASAVGGEARLVVEESENPEWSPDGRWISFWRGQLWIAAPDGTGRRQLTRHRVRAHRWAPDGTAIYTSRDAALLAIAPEDGRERVIANLGGRPGELGQFALATDGQHLYFTWNESIADLWVMTAEVER